MRPRTLRWRLPTLPPAVATSIRTDRWYFRKKITLPDGTGKRIFGVPTDTIGRSSGQDR